MSFRDVEIEHSSIHLLRGIPAILPIGVQENGANKGQTGVVMVEFSDLWLFGIAGYWFATLSSALALPWDPIAIAGIFPSSSYVPLPF